MSVTSRACRASALCDASRMQAIVDHIVAALRL
jgi:hypothetical protein